MLNLVLCAMEIETKKYHVIPSLKEHVCNALEEKRGPYLKPLFLSAMGG